MADETKTFVVSDEELNSYGFWVKTSGIRIDKFKKNPVMLYDHDRYGVLPIGTWDNIRIENGQVLADPVFDEEDEYGKEIARKVNKGIIRGASIGFRVMKMSDAPGDMKPGQTRPTVLASDLVEISVTPFPSNTNSLRLYDQGKKINLSQTSESQLNEIIPTINKQDTNMKEVAIKLGLSADAKEADVVAAIDALQKKRDGYKTKLSATFMKLGEATGDITDDNRERMQKLADTDYDLALSFITAKKEERKETGGDEKKDKEEGTLRLSDLIRELQGGKKSEDSEKDYDWYQKKDPVALNEMREKEPEKFQKLFDEHFKEA